jgi:hypothetical protein
LPRPALLRASFGENGRMISSFLGKVSLFARDESSIITLVKRAYQTAYRDCHPERRDRELRGALISQSKRTSPWLNSVVDKFVRGPSLRSG